MHATVTVEVTDESNAIADDWWKRRIKAIELYPDGSLKRVELFGPCTGGDAAELAPGMGFSTTTEPAWRTVWSSAA